MFEFDDFYDYLYQILLWCQLNCLYFNNKSVDIKQQNEFKNEFKNEITDDDWVDYGFGENEVIH